MAQSDPVFSGNNFLGVAYGQKGLTTSFETLVDGLTTSRYIVVNTLSTNLGDVVIADKRQAGTGAGFQLQKDDPPVQIDLQNDNSRILVKATAVGTTVSYIGVNGVGD